MVRNHDWQWFSCLSPSPPASLPLLLLLDILLPGPSRLLFNRLHKGPKGQATIIRIVVVRCCWLDFPTWSLLGYRCTRVLDEPVKRLNPFVTKVLELRPNSFKDGFSFAVTGKKCNLCGSNGLEIAFPCLHHPQRRVSNTIHYVVVEGTPEENVEERLQFVAIQMRRWL